MMMTMLMMEENRSGQSKNGGKKTNFLPYRDTYLYIYFSIILSTFKIYNNYNNNRNACDFTKWTNG